MTITSEYVLQREGDAEIYVPVRLWETIGHTPHAGQLDFRQKLRFPRRDDDPFYYAVDTSRRWGKTEIAKVLLIEGILYPDDDFGPPYVPLIADTYEHANKVWDRFVNAIFNTSLRGMVERYDKDRERLQLTTGGIAQKFSADRPQSLTGEGVYPYAILDESQFISDEAMDQFFPSTTERGGGVVAFGIAEGDNWFREWEILGDDPEYPEHVHLAYPWYTSPYIPERFIKNAERKYTPERFGELYLAKRPDDQGGFFRNVDNCIYGTVILEPGFQPLILQEPIEGHRYGAGIDVAKVADYTVVKIADLDTRKIVAFHRLPHQSYTTQADPVCRLLLKYAARALMDETGVGKAVIEIFRSRLNELINEEFERTHRILDRRPTIEGVTFTPGEKMDMADELKLGFEREQVKIPNIGVLVRELKRYQALKNQNTGRIKLSAPPKLNDDCVSALMLLYKLFPKIKAYSGMKLERRRASWED